MPFIPHSENDIKAMLAEIGVNSIEQLFDEIPAELKIDALPNIPQGMSEMEVGRLMQTLAEKNKSALCFIGAGAYEHHIPAAVWDIVGRGEFYSAYTPYQAEASQGTLQLLYEFQTMMANLTGMDVSNASLYDGATALAEAILMAARLHRGKTKKIIVPRSLAPNYRQVIKSIVELQAIEIIEIPFDAKTGVTDFAALTKYNNQEITALIIPQPNFFGALEEVDQLTNWAQQQNALVIGVVNPLSLALLKEPSSWGDKGADIVCGEAQPLGIPLASGGPYLGLLTCKKEYVRQMPGRIVGRTTDLEGRTAFTLTLQAREQHIRRSKATSNICTNQSLLVTAATIHMSLLGTEGLRRVAAASHENMLQLQQLLTQIPGIKVQFTAPSFHEFVVQLDRNIPELLEQLSQLGILGGYDLQLDYPELKNCLLICVTETKSAEDLNYFYETMQKICSQTTNDNEAQIKAPLLM